MVLRKIDIISKMYSNLLKNPPRILNILQWLTMILSVSMNIITPIKITLVLTPDNSTCNIINAAMRCKIYFMEECLNKP